jgi:nitroreductase
MNAEELHLVTTFASLAPSVHNTQPWQFVADGHTLEVRADPDRKLTVLDQSARQLHLSCGAAVEFARLAIRWLDYSCVVRLLPRADDRLLLATLTAGHSLPARAGERRLVEAAPRRYTDRGPYDDRPVPRAVVMEMADAAGEVGCWLRPLDRPGDRLVAAILVDKAEAIEIEDPNYRDELAKWRRDYPGAPDGLPAEAVQPWPVDRVPDVPVRDFGGEPHYPHVGAERPPQVERDTLVLLGSDSDGPLGWLRTGRALASILLVATDAGLVTQPLGQVTDVAATRAQLQRSLGLLGHPQLLLRVGYGFGHPQTGRRPTEETLRVASVA